MKWFKKRKKANEEAGFLFQHTGIAIEESDVLLFPDRELVFETVSTLHNSVFFPLCSIKMALLNPTWDFYAHFVYVYREPEEKVDYMRYYTSYCGDYSLGFDCIEGKYDLQAKAKMLEISAPYQKYQQKANKKYERFVQDYQEHGLMNLLPANENLNFLIKRFGSSPIWVQRDETPVDLDGEALLFVGQVRVLDFIGEEQYLYLFYNPKFHYFVQREQYT
ncbi:hypothetical protein [Aureispira anguillae]|uniref:Uncharacterized protein n=1 Tax=Aureispira anguillae TaxID=2864201 RepID=A0A915YKL7_9BACT|nr:hypothetical protein [Aureispira anguillae]BDS14960.1 hypothetical protein AsAng_0057420 [Aureispira anguillae]